MFFVFNVNKYVNYFGGTIYCLIKKNIKQINRFFLAIRQRQLKTEIYQWAAWKIPQTFFFKLFLLCVCVLHPLSAKCPELPSIRHLPWWIIIIHLCIYRIFLMFWLQLFWGIQNIYAIVLGNPNLKSTGHKASWL